MESGTKLSLSGAVADVRRRIQVWRKTRQRRGRIPDDLWQEAAQLARCHGVNPIARALSLEYCALKRHVNDTKAKEAEMALRPAFVEVSAFSPVPSPDCVVEMERRDGGRMRVRLASQGDLVALSESFWRCQS